MAEALAPVHLPKQAGKAAPAKMRKLPRGVMEALAKKGAESERLNMERGVQPEDREQKAADIPPTEDREDGDE